MTLAGTRPPTLEEWEKYELHHRARLAIKPGITGMWQVSGRSDITDFEEVVKLDMKYIANWNFGFGMTVQDKNAPDLVPLYKISNEMGMEFATASLHNSFYFVEAKNIIHDRPMVAKNFENLVNELLRSNSPKKWFRAYFNHGLINYIYRTPIAKQVLSSKKLENLGWSGVFSAEIGVKHTLDILLGK